MKPPFWSRPFEFSFKDVLAIIFTGTFLYFCWRALKSHDALALVQALIPLVGIILGGYFVQESAAMWFQRSQGMQQYPYGGYGYSGYYTPPVTPAAPATPDDSEQGTANQSNPNLPP